MEWLREYSDFITIVLIVAGLGLLNRIAQSVAAIQRMTYKQVYGSDPP